jgi:DNA-binding GntR family transcriptional regulator
VEVAEINAESASVRAYRALEHAIVTLDLAPGSITTEGFLIERLGFGRTPLREAIQRLAWEGLIEIRPRAGLAIAPLHASDWLKVLDARAGIEIVLARSAARFITPQSGEQFQNAAQAMHRAVVDSDVSGYLAADKALDEAMARAADNAFAARLAAPLQTHSRRFWFRYQRETGLAESAARHVELIQTILDRDETGAAIEAERLMLLLRTHAQVAISR